MYKGYKIVVNTAAGRRRYMRYLIPYIIECDIVDRYDIWVHTHNCADIEFFKLVAEKYPKVNLVWQPDGIVGGNATINAFYRECIDEETIYFKIDDDVIWMEKDAIKKMLDYRIEHPDFFIVSPLVINNPICTYLLQASGRLQLRQYQASNPFGDILWTSGDFAYELHDWFIGNAYIDNCAGLHIGSKTIGANRLSINAILWFGKDLKKIDGVVPGDDEEFLSCMYPTSKGLANGVNGDCVMVHYAFCPQRAMLDASNLLARYDVYYAGHMSQTSNVMQLIINDIDSRIDEISTRQSPYIKPVTPPTPKVPIVKRIYRLLPNKLRNIIRPQKYAPMIIRGLL